MPDQDKQVKLKESGVLVRLAWQGLRKMGHDADEVLRRSGISTDKLYDTELRTDFSAQPLFWQAAEQVSGDKDIGLHLGEYLPVYKGQILEYLFLSSPTFYDGLKRAINYQRLISDALQLKLVDTGKDLYVSNTFADPDSAGRHLTECLVQGLIKLLQHVTDGAFQPKEVGFRHDQSLPAEEYQRAFGCPVSFNQEEFRLYFDRSMLEHRSLHAQPELLKVHEQVANEHLAKLAHSDFVQQASRQIGALLENGEVTLEAVADRMDISVRQLRHQLEQGGSSFQKEVNRYRHRLAKRLLGKTDESISEIVYLTGFSEPSTFYRAFKRWEGITPIEYRKQQQVEN
ncbi:MAG: AraC family transcriptional regulator [Cellvibrionaceae bacterium]